MKVQIVKLSFVFAEQMRMREYAMAIYVHIGCMTITSSIVHISVIIVIIIICNVACVYLKRRNRVILRGGNQQIRCE